MADFNTDQLKKWLKCLEMNVINVHRCLLDQSFLESLEIINTDQDLKHNLVHGEIIVNINNVLHKALKILLYKDNVRREHFQKQLKAIDKDNEKLVSKLREDLEKTMNQEKEIITKQLKDQVEIKTNECIALRNTINGLTEGLESNRKLINKLKKKHSLELIEQKESIMQSNLEHVDLLEKELKNLRIESDTNLAKEKNRNALKMRQLKENYKGIMNRMKSA